MSDSGLSEPIEIAERSPRTVRSVVHAVKLLKAIAKSTAPNTLRELATAVGLSKPATFNLLKTLEVEGLVSKDYAARYALTWGVYELGSAVVRTADVSRIARVHLDKLAESRSRPAGWWSFSTPCRSVV